MGVKRAILSGMIGQYGVKLSGVTPGMGDVCSRKLQVPHGFFSRRKTVGREFVEFVEVIYARASHDKSVERWWVCALLGTAVTGHPQEMHSSTG